MQNVDRMAAGSRLNRDLEPLFAPDGKTQCMTSLIFPSLKHMLARSKTSCGARFCDQATGAGQHACAYSADSATLACLISISGISNNGAAT